MAEQKRRSQSIQEQIDRLTQTAPRPYTSDEVKQIEKGRKGQKEIDEGRATIERRNKEVREFNEQIGRLNEQLGIAAESEAKLGRQMAEDERIAARRAEKESPLVVGMDAASKVPAGLLGYAVGRGVIGGGINYATDKAQELKNKVLERIAGDRVKGLTTSAGARTGAERAGVMPSANSVLRVGGRMLPHAIAGTGMIAKGGASLYGSSPDDPFVTQAIDRGAGYGLLGAGVGILEKGAQYGVAPGMPADGQAIAQLDSNQLRRGGLNAARPTEVDKGPVSALPAPDEPRGPAPGSKEHLREQAKALGAKVTTRMTKEELAKAIATKATEAGAKRVRAPKLPKGTGAAGIAGGLAYAMTPDGAQAADGSQSSNQGQALTNAGLAGGAAYGASKGLDAIGPIAKTVMTGAGEAMAPLAIDSMTDYSPTEQLQGRVALGEYLPEALQSAPIRQAHQMAQVPSRNPARPTGGMFEQGNDPEFEAALQAFLQEYEADNGSPEGTMAEAY